jgi:hypothetical protein
MRRGALAIGLCALVLIGCGEGRTVGGAAETWCHRHWPQSSKTESVCFNAIFEQRNPKKFLETLESGDQIDAEIDALEGMMRP